jgi:poly-gamma-glutamate capsule biosynthesis protein CapA/YwtB (metallophosphatase superfamily)
MPFLIEAMPQASIFLKTEDRARRLMPASAALCCVLALAACSETPKPSLTLVAGGDCLFDRGTTRAIPRYDPSSRPDPRWEGISSALRGSDAFIFNLETTIGSGGSPKDKSFVFRSPARSLEGLRDFPRPIACLANNHSMDYGPGGLISTIGELDAAGVAHAGAGMDAAKAASPARASIGDCLVSVFSCGVDNDEASFAAEARPGIAPIETGALASRIEESRRGSAAIVVMLHWGTEYATAYDPSEVLIARALVDAGADLVVASGPHVVRGIEEYKGSLICYSLGNLLFDDTSGLETSAGILVRMQLVPSRRTGLEKRFSIAPLRTKSAAAGPRAPTLEDARRIMGAIAERSPDRGVIDVSGPIRQAGLLWFNAK